VADSACLCSLTGGGAEACTYEASCSALQTPIGTPETFL
jgi:hypothetical protein